MFEKLYCGCIKNDGNAGYDFKYSTIKVESEYAGGYIVDKEYCTSNGYFTKYITYEELDTARKITNEITCMYSTDKNRIVKWLSSEREKLLADVEMKYNSLKKSVIDEIADVNSIFAPNANKEPLDVNIDKGWHSGIFYICPHCGKKVSDDVRPEYGSPKKIPCEHCGGPIIWTARWDYSDIRD